jgi:hypothetical protein
VKAIFSATGILRASNRIQNRRWYGWLRRDCDSMPPPTNYGKYLSPEIQIDAYRSNENGRRGIEVTFQQ